MSKRRFVGAMFIATTFTDVRKGWPLGSGTNCELRILALFRLNYA
jgi:hypothetical protein